MALYQGCIKKRFLINRLPDENSLQVKHYTVRTVYHGVLSAAIRTLGLLKHTVSPQDMRASLPRSEIIWNFSISIGALG